MKPLYAYTTDTRTSVGPGSESLLETRCSASLPSAFGGHSVRSVDLAYPALPAAVVCTPFDSLLFVVNVHLSVAAPKEGEAAQVPEKAPDAVDLTQAIAIVASTTPVYSEAKLPPKVPVPFKRWRPERAPDAPHDRNAYFPMLLYK